MSLTHLRICLDSAEYDKKRRPYFIRFMDNDFKLHHRKVESFSFVRDSVLEVSFLFDEALEKLPSQMPLVCYDPEDDGGMDESESERGFREIYRSKCERIAAVRNQLDAHFPQCDQEGIGYLDNNDMFAVIRLLPNFSVAVTSTVSIFLWDKGVTIDSIHFKTVSKVVRYADRHYPGMRAVESGSYFKADQALFRHAATWFD